MTIACDVALHEGKRKMSLDFSTSTVVFRPVTGRVQSSTAIFSFSSEIRTADAFMKGFKLEFNNGEHPLNQTEVSITLQGIVNSGSTHEVRVGVDFYIKDNSGFFDDPYSGFVIVGVVVDRA
jgi:hypothetical protein